MRQRGIQANKLEPQYNRLSKKYFIHVTVLSLVFDEDQARFLSHSCVCTVHMTVCAVSC